MEFFLGCFVGIIVGLVVGGLFSKTPHVITTDEQQVRLLHAMQHKNERYQDYFNNPVVNHMKEVERKTPKH